MATMGFLDKVNDLFDRVDRAIDKAGDIVAEDKPRS